MYRVIIVDDEDMIRNVLKTFVKWNELGLTVVGEASNGNDAFELIKELNPHIVITDIKMPCCSGLELMEKIKESEINTKIIILSGYDEFEYVKSALEVGAVDYILKPVKFNQLQQVLTKIKNDYDARIKESVKTNEGYKLRKEKFLFRLVKGLAGNAEDIARQAEEFKICFDGRYYLVMLIELSCNEDLTCIHEKDMELFDFAIKNISEEFCSRIGSCHAFSHKVEEVIAIVGLDCSDMTEFKNVVQEMKNYFDGVFNLTTTISIGAVCEGVTSIKNSYLSARNNLNYVFSLGTNRIIYPEDTNPSGLSANINEDQIENKLLSSLQNYDIDSACELVDQVFKGLKSKDAFYRAFYVFTGAVERFLKKNSIGIHEITEGTITEYQQLAEKQTLKEITAALKAFLAKAIEYLHSINYKCTSKVVMEIKDFVEKYYREDISLDTIAQRVYMHPTYLSKVFKKETGMNFTYYLTAVRIDKARELMQDVNLKTYEISEKVGYATPKYFSKVFKSITGVTPKEYRKNVAGYDEAVDVGG